MEPQKRWSRKTDCCLRCQTSTVPHMAKGLCSRCYLEVYRADPANTARIAAAKDRWYKKLTREERLMARDKHHFDGLAVAVLARDEHKCTSCGSTDQLVVHHIDGAGRGSKQPNNTMANLITLCRACHAALHGTTGRWSRHYMACTRCGTTSKRHNAHGLCIDCYQYIRYRSKHSEDMIRTSVKAEEE